MRTRFFRTAISFFRFYLLGISNFFLFLFLFYLCHTVFGLNYIWATLIAYSCIVISAGLGNVFFVFREHITNNSKYILVFFTMLVYLSSLMLELFSVHLLAQSFKMNIYIIQILVYMFSSVYCFTLNKLLIFSS